MSLLSNLHNTRPRTPCACGATPCKGPQLPQLKDIVAAADQAHLAADHQEHAIHYATKAAKECVEETPQ